MPGTKKPRRKYRPAHAARAVNPKAAFEVLQKAQVTKEILENFHVPMDAEDQRDAAIAFGLSIDAITRGKGSYEHMQTIATMCNTSLILCERDVGKQYEQDIVAALDGVFRAHLRFKWLGKLGFDAVALAAVRKAYDVYAAQVAIAGRGELIAAENAVEQRVKEGNFYREAA